MPSVPPKSRFILAHDFMMEVYVNRLSRKPWSMSNVQIQTDKQGPELTSTCTLAIGVAQQHRHHE